MRSEFFEETVKQHKDSLTDELEQLGKHRQAQLAGWDIEQYESDYEFYFNAAWNHQQCKVDDLQKRVDRAIRLLVEAELYQSEPNIDLAVQALKGGGK